MKVKESLFISENRELFRKLQRTLSEKYDFASVLAADSREGSHSVSAQGIRAAQSDMFGRRGFVCRVYSGGAYAEYAGNEISEELIPGICAQIGGRLEDMSRSFERLAAPLAEDKELSFVKSSEYDIHPEEFGSERIVGELSAMRESILSSDEALLDCQCRLSYQEYHKFFVSNKKDLEQNVLWTCGGIFAMVSRGDEIKDAYKGFSVLGGVELLDKMKSAAPSVVKTAKELLGSEPMIPGEYDCICSPELTGMIAHEAFGHGVEMDMFVKDRAQAAGFVGDYVASPLVSMHDGAAAACEVASYFFDDEGNVAKDTLVIDKGRLVSGYADAVSAARLGVPATGNGRRESVERKAYTRMTNTFFEGGRDKLEDMIASVEYGMLLEDPTSGMEDPKNWGIQCMVSHAREIRNGKLTGRIFSPVVLTGYVPDLLKSISMMSEDVDICGSGACGKGHKEWVKVSDGGPWIKARIRLG